MDRFTGRIYCPITSYQTHRRFLHFENASASRLCKWPSWKLPRYAILCTLSPISALYFFSFCCLPPDLFVGGPLLEQPPTRTSLQVYPASTTLPATSDNRVEAVSTQSKDKYANNSGCSSEKKELHSLFLDRLLKVWEDRRLRGLFHHDITACETKILPGVHGFIVVLVEGRDLKKRPTEFGLDKVLQHFDERKFNFMKIGQEEVLFRFEESENGEARYIEHAPVMASACPSVIAINVSPIAYGHVLLIPHILDCMPQRIDRESFLLAMHMAREAQNPYFRVGYNSLGGFATINHIHFQAYYLTESFPVEKAPTQRIATSGSGVKISQLLRYPVRGLVFEGGSSLEDLSNVVSSACIFLQDNNFPYNALISDSGMQIFLLPQCYAEKRVQGKVRQEILEMQVNPAIWELSGHFALKRRQDYEEASEGSICSFLEIVSLSEEQFAKMKGYILEAFASGRVKDVMERAERNGKVVSNDSSCKT